MFSTDFLLRALDSTIDPIYVADQEFHLCYVNDAACNALEYTRDELLKMTAFDIDPVTDFEHIKESVALCDDPHHKIIRFKTKHQTKSGHVFPVEITVSELMFEGKIYGISIARDISESERNKELLKEKQKQLELQKAAMDSASDAIYIIDNAQEGKLLYVSDAACKMLEYTQAELVGLHVRDIEAQMSDEELRHRREMRAFTTISKHRTKTGKMIDIEISATTFTYDENDFRIAIIKDLAQQKQVQADLMQREEEFRSLAENIPVYILRWDTDARYLYLNTAIENLMGVTLDEVYGKCFYEVVGDNFIEVQRAYEKVLNTQEKVYLEKIMIPMLDQSIEIHNINFVPEFDENRKLVSVLCAGWNMTDIYNLQEELQIKERELRFLAEFTPGMMSAFHIIADNVRLMLYVSPKIRDIYGIDPEFVKENAKALDALIYPDDLEKLYETYEESVRNMSVWNQQYRIAHPQKGERWIEENSTPVRHNDGGITWYGYIHDITEQKAFEAKIEYMAYNDVLTNLPNRVLARDRATQAIANAGRDGLKVALFFIDLDGFKTINDSLGHGVGDKMLVSVASRLKERIRESDTISRHGGDEFILVSSIESSTNAVGIAREILQRFKQPFYIQDQILSVSASIGIAIYPDNGLDYETLLKEADIAMYHAKESGKNGYAFSKEGMSANILNQLTIQNELPKALEENQFELYYQPQVDLNGTQVIGVEALIRWHHPEHGMISPIDFIPIAENSGHIIALGEWIIHEACKQVAQWNRMRQRALVVAVNISAIQFKRGNLVAIVVDALHTSGLRPALLELEMTESIMMHNIESVLTTVQELKAMGVKLSIDDFGTGYSSLSYLKHFTTDKLKIDRSFVMDILQDEEDAAIVRAIIQMAKGLHLRTIAEGVEDEKTLEILKSYGCDEVQGYYFAKPMNPKDFETYCKRVCGVH